MYGHVFFELVSAHDPVVIPFPSTPKHLFCSRGSEYVHILRDERQGLDLQSGQDVPCADLNKALERHA